MKVLSFQQQNGALVSESFNGGTAVQVAKSSGKVIRVGIETCISSDLGWSNHSSVMLENSTKVFQITEAGKDQLFRLRVVEPIDAIISVMKIPVDLIATEVMALSQSVDSVKADIAQVTAAVSDAQAAADAAQKTANTAQTKADALEKNYNLISVTKK